MLGQPETLHEAPGHSAKQKATRLTPQQRLGLGKLMLWSQALVIELRIKLQRCVERLKPLWLGQGMFEWDKFRYTAFAFRGFFLAAISREATDISRLLARVSSSSSQPCRLIMRSMRACPLQLRENSGVVAFKTKDRRYSRTRLARFLKRGR